jgi:hypothetical protein
MAHQPKCSIVASLELILQAARKKMHLPARVVEAELVTATSSQEFACPKISKKLALHFIMLSQDYASLSHSSILRISFSFVSLELIFYDIF